MDLWQLHIFLKVVDLKSFSRAGRAVHLSQPTVSSHIKDLEAHFDCRLIDRLAKEALPTKAGGLLYRYAKRMISPAGRNRKCHGRIQGQGQRQPGFGWQYDSRCLRITGDHRRLYQDAFLKSVSACPSPTPSRRSTLFYPANWNWVWWGAVSTHAGILQTHLVDDELCLVVPAGHRWSGKKRVTTKQLFTEPFIIREQGSGTLKSIKASFSEAGLNVDDLKVVARIGSTEAIRQGIKNRMGGVYSFGHRRVR